MKFQHAIVFIFLITLPFFLAAQETSDSTPEKQEKQEPLTFPENLTPEAAFLARLSGLFQVEDPASLYAFELYDQEVEFILDGTWETNLIGTLSISFSGNAETLTITPPIFTQTVDMSTWLFLNKTWYFEASFAEEFTRNTVAVGYVGNEETTIKHVRLGNSGIVFPNTYPFIEIGGGKVVSPGIMGTFSGNNWNADTLVRYTAATERELVLSGMNEVTDEFLPINAPVFGKWFVLPSSAITGTVTVYVEDENGIYRDDSSRINGRRWRKLNMAEYRVHSIEGILELEFETSKSVAVVYTGDWITGGGTAGTDLSQFVSETRDWFDASGASLPAGYLPNPTAPSYITDLGNHFMPQIDGTPVLLLQERGHFSPFLLASRYRTTGTNLDVIYTETETRVSNLSAQAFEGQFAEIFRTDITAPPAGRDRYRTPASRFPLAPEFPRIYLPAGRQIDTGITIRARTYIPTGTLSLGENAIAGTIRVVRNGITDTAFQFDQESSLLTLIQPPRTGETIRITWSDSDESSRNATLTLAGGIAWKVTDALDFSLASAFSWNLSQEGYTDASEKSPGSFIVSAGTTFTGETIKLETAFAMEMAMSDTTGFYRILGMEGSLRRFYPHQSWYVRTPAAVEPILGLPAFGSLESLYTSQITLEKENRIPINNTDGDLLPYQSSSSMGGAILILSSTHSDVSHWSSGDILTGIQGGNDFRSVAALSLVLRNPGSRDDFDIFLQLGARTEDYYEDPDTVRTWHLSTPPAGTGWMTQTVALDDSDRSALTAGQNLRIILRPRDGSTGNPPTILPVSFTIETSRIELKETAFAAQPEPSFTGSGRLISEEIDDPVSLVSFDSTTVKRFNPSIINRVLAVNFTPEPTTQKINLIRTIPEVPLWEYGSLSFYLYAKKLPDPADRADASVLVSLTRPRNSGFGYDTALDLEIQALALEENRWHKITVNLDSRIVSIDGSELPTNLGRVIHRNRDIIPIRTEISFINWKLPTPPPENSKNGGTTAPTLYTVYIDEFHLEGCDPVLTGKNKTAFTWDRPGSLVEAGSVNILSDPRLSVTADSSVSQISSVVAGTAQTELTILNAKTEATITASSTTERVTDSAGYSVTLPLGFVQLQENYFADFAGNAFQRDNSLRISGIIPLAAQTSLDFSGRTLYRSMGLETTPKVTTKILGTFTISLGSIFTQTGVSPHATITETGWQRLWTDTLTYSVSPGESDATERTGKSSFKTDWSTPFSQQSFAALTAIRFTANAESSYRSAASVSRTSRGEGILSFPIRIGTTVLTPSWNRSIGGEQPVTVGGDYWGDTEYLFSDLGDMNYLFTIAPIYDLFVSEMEEKIRDPNSQSSRLFFNNYTLSWYRITGSGLKDLWIPLKIETAVSRKTETSAAANTFQDIWSSSIQAGFTAINIAGTYGLVPIFTWYEQDEFSQLYRWSSSWGGDFFTWNMDTWHSILLFFSNGATISLDNAFHYDSPSISGANELTRDTLSLIWKRPGPDSFVADLISRITERVLTTRREDSLRFTITKAEEITLGVNWGHTLTTGIGTNGEVSLTGGTGFSRNQDGSAVLELLLGIGGKLTY